MFFGPDASGRHARTPETTTGPTHTAPPDAEVSLLPPAARPTLGADARRHSERSCDPCASSRPIAHAIAPTEDAPSDSSRPPTPSRPSPPDANSPGSACRRAGTSAAIRPNHPKTSPSRPAPSGDSHPAPAARPSSSRAKAARKSPPGPSITRGGAASTPSTAAPPTVVRTAFMARPFPSRGSGPGACRRDGPPAAEPRNGRAFTQGDRSGEPALSGPHGRPPVPPRLIRPGNSARNRVPGARRTRGKRPKAQARAPLELAGGNKPDGVQATP